MASTQPRSYEPTPARKVAFLGLGVMGAPMAAHLALAGHQVTVYNRTASKAIALSAQYTGANGQNGSTNYPIKHAETPR